MNVPSKTKANCRRDRGSARIVLVFAVSFLLGAGVSMFFYRFARHEGTPTDGAAGETSLSQSTLSLLQRLPGTFEIRYYSLLDPATVPDSVKPFAGRVEQLLNEYQKASGGKIKVSRIDTASNASANAALADGLKPFNQDKGDACYLGIAVAYKGQRESLPQLSSDWETALESDLSRAIARLSEAAAVSNPTPTASPTDPAAIEEVKRALTNYAAISLEDGTRVLRQAALTEFSQTAAEMETRLKEAQQRFVEAEKNQSEEAKLAAHQQIQQLQAEQNEKLKQIVARSQAQIEALQKLKAEAK